MSDEIIDINEYKEILSSIKNEILKSQYKASLYNILKRQ